MSQWDKLLHRILSLANDIRFEEAQKVLEAYGFERVTTKSGSSHVAFRKSGSMTISIPRGDPLKKVYVQMVRNVVERNGEAKK